MSTSRLSLRTQVLTRLGDLAQQVWTATEVELQLQEGYEALAQASAVFYDWVYLENLPRAFNYTAGWERVHVGTAIAPFVVGVGNFTATDEEALLGDVRTREGPANSTSPFEAIEGHLARAGADLVISATADLPTTVTSLTRVSWDQRGVDGLEARRLSHVDARYEITRGEVYGFIWQKDGIRTLRKVRVPAAQADSVIVDGDDWGVIRDPADLSTERPTPRVWPQPGFDAGGFASGRFYTLETDGPVWGVPRRIPGEHPIGDQYFGLSRRPFREGKNVRVEYARQGRAVTHDADAWELPDRYALYLRDFAMAQCLGRRGPGQDVKLAAHFQQRWTRGLARVARRLQTVDPEHVSVLGGDARPLTRRPPRPSRPWPYGAEVR